MAAPSSQLRIESELKEYSFTSVHRLQRSPEMPERPEYCSQYRAEKLSPLAFSVEKLGWIVTSVAPLARFQAVTFVSGFNPGTSGLCLARNANIAVFDGNELVALAYAKSKLGPALESDPAPLGVVEPLEDGMGLLIRTDPPGIPVGEFHVAGEKLRLTARAMTHANCRGSAIVPDIYGKGIDTARRMLFTQDWKPERPAEGPEVGDMAREMSEKGLIEAEMCSGTGFGYCSWNYRGKAGVLHVVTVGGDSAPSANTVSSFNVECNAE